VFLFNSIKIWIDIQSHKIRLIIWKHRKKNLQIERESHIELPLGAIMNGKIQDFQTVYQAFLMLLTQTKVKKGQAIVTIPAQPAPQKSIFLMHPLNKNHIDLKTYFPEIKEPLSITPITAYLNLVQQAGFTVILIAMGLNLRKI